MIISVLRAPKSRLIALVGVALVASSCGSSSNGGTKQAAPAGDARCMNVPNAVVKAIRTGITAQGGGTLRFVQAVKSNDFSSVYFISGDIQASGLEGSDDVATWATNRLRLGGLIMSVDAVAQEFSDWGHGDTTDANLSMSDDGAELSKECVASVAK